MNRSRSGEMSDGRPMLRRGKSNLEGWIATLRRAPRGSGAVRLWPLSGRVVVGAAVAVLALGAVVSMIDAWAMGESGALSPAVRSFFGIITDLGWSGWILWSVGIALILLSLVTTPRVGHIGTLVVTAIAVRLTFVFAAVALPGLFVAIVKRLIGRARPHVNGAADPNLYDPFSWTAGYASLPSGHATTAFATAVAIGALWPKARPYLWTYAVLVAVSRVVVFAHYPSDVIAGAVVGVLGAMLVRNWFAARRLAFSVGADGTIRRPATPSCRRIKALVHHPCAA